MSYVVHIKRLRDGKVIQHKCPMPWGEGSLYWWTEGNMGCDCNLHHLFEPDDVEGVECGESLYKAERAVFEDGTEVILEY